ncbi:MAG: hypothetical protein AAGI68_16785 [Planctomycetota bacterium]
MNATPTKESTRAILDAWQILCRYRWRFVLPAFAVAAAVLAAGMVVPRKHRAEAHFERRIDMVLTEMISRGGSDSFKDPRNSLSDEIAGKAALDYVIEKHEPTLIELGVIESAQDKHALVNHLVKEIIVHWDVRSQELDRVRLELTTLHPEAAKLIVNGLINHYIDRTRIAMEERLHHSVDFFQAEVTTNRTELEKLESQSLQFEIKHGELLPDSPNNVQNKLADAEIELAELENQRKALKLRVEALAQEANNEPVLVTRDVRGPNPKATRLEANLRQLQTTRNNLITTRKMKTVHPEILAIDQQMGVIQGEIDALPATVILSTAQQTNPKRQQLDTQLTTLRADARALDQQISDQQSRVAAFTAAGGQLFPVRSEYRKLQRNIDQANRQIKFWEDNLRRISMALTAESGNRGVQLNFLRPAVANPIPISPNFHQVLAAAMVFGIGAGVLSVFFAHRSDNSVPDQESLAQITTLPVLGAISELLSEKQKKARHFRNWVLYPTNALAMATVLAAIGTVLYLDLNQPDTLRSWKSHLLGISAPAQLSEPTEPTRTTTTASLTGDTGSAAFQTDEASPPSDSAP